MENNRLEIKNYLVKKIPENCCNINIISAMRFPTFNTLNEHIL